MIATCEPGLNGPLVAGVDVGGTKTSVVVIDDRDRILYEHVTSTDRSSLVGQIAGLVDDARRQLRQEVAAVGVAIPGHVDPADGSVSMAVRLGITHLPLGPMLQTELGVPTFVKHDARAAVPCLSVHPALLEPIRSRIARERAASPLAQAALGDATVELLSPIEASGARGAAAIARHRLDLPEREGVGER
jgi:ROK family